MSTKINTIYEHDAGMTGNREPGTGSHNKDNPFTVEVLVRLAALTIEEHIGTVWVTGEVSNLRTPVSGHVYFILKDERAQLPTVMWRRTASRLGFKLEEGKQFLLCGKLGIYPEQGKFQLYVETVEPAGLGAAALALEQLKKRLMAEGLFAPARKRPLPRLPRRIGVVTSPTGAAVRDIIRVVERRFPVPIVVSPTRVQGDGAAEEIAAAIVRLNSIPNLDVVIVGRGGGSAEDLSAFNDERVVRAIACCPAPVISAVGHEVDVTLSDLVADVRAATPTAAGELAVPERTVLAEELQTLTLHLEREMSHGFVKKRSQLERVAARLEDPTRQILRNRQRVDEAWNLVCAVLRRQLPMHRREILMIEQRLLALHPRTRLMDHKAALVFQCGRLQATLRASFVHKQRRFETLVARLQALSPLAVLQRGYALVHTSSGQLVTQMIPVKVGDDWMVRLAWTEVDVRVTGMRK